MASELEMLELKDFTGSTMEVFVSGTSLVDIEICGYEGERIVDDAVYTLDTTDAARLIDWLNAWLKMQQEPVAHRCTWHPLHFGGIVVGCTSIPWSGDVPKVCPHCHNPMDIGELSY